MTEAQLRSFPAFKKLPIFDECDQQADTITSTADGSYSAIREFTTLQQVADALNDPRLVPLGGLRVGVNGGTVVIAYFGERN